MYGGRHHSPSAFSSPASTTLFRRLTWEGTVPLEIRVDSKELPANSNRGLECYFIQAPRVSYLPLLVPEIKRFLMDIVFDEEAAKLLKEEDWWFESEGGGLLKWSVASPIRRRWLIFDFFVLISIMCVGTGRLASSMTIMSSSLLSVPQRPHPPKCSPYPSVSSFTSPHLPPTSSC